MTTVMVKLKYKLLCGEKYIHTSAEVFFQKITGHFLQRDSVKGQHLFFLEFGGQ